MSTTCTTCTTCREPTARRLTVGLLAALFFALFLGLGTWQIERRAWKLDLIGRVNHRVHTAAVDAPLRTEWPSVTAATHEYRRVRISGVFLPEQTRVQALTELGSGFWLLTPLRTSDGGIVLINRGFVSGERAAAPPDPEPGRVTVTGLLRMPEPGGGFLRRNDAANDRWFSRDVQAIAAAHGIGPVAPYFIDAEAPQRPDTAAGPLAPAPTTGSVPDAARDQLPGTIGAPVAGLTVISFHNNHLIYAITWYTLALMIPAALWLARRPTAANPP